MSGLFNILASFLIMPSIIHHKYVLNSLLIVGPIGNRPIPILLLLLLLWPVSDFHSQSLIYHIEASGTPQPTHFLKAHYFSYPNSDKIQTKNKDSYKDNDKDKDAKRITEIITVCYTFGILKTQAFQMSNNDNQQRTTNNNKIQTTTNNNK